MGRAIVTALFCLSLFIVPPAALAQEDAPAPATGQNVMMVLDASGSMWGQIDGKAKIEIARGVIDGLLTEWDPSISLGLMAYGHRQKGDCADIETLAPVGTVDKAGLMAKVNALNPKGKTPITASVRQAADELKYTEEKATVILISDGLETCDADPCQLATELDAKGVDFTAHVVGFDLSDEDSKSLQCIADNSGGKFISASNAAELTTALGETVQAVKEEPAGPQGLRLRAKLCEDCEIITDGQMFWWVFEPETDLEGKRKEVARAGRAAPIVELPVGRYVVNGRYGGGALLRSVDAEVTEGELTDVVVNLEGGALRLAAVPSEGGEVLKDNMFYWVLSPAKDLQGNQKEFARAGVAKPTIWLPADDYVARARHGKAFTDAALTVEPGKVTDHTFDMQVGYLKASAIPAPGGDVLKDKMFYWVLETEKDLQGNQKEMDRAGTATPLFRIPAGTYLLRARHGKAFAEQEVTVTAGQLTEVQLDMQVGYLKASMVMAEGGAAVKNKAFYWVLKPEKDLQGKQPEIDRAGVAAPTFRLPKGDYVLRSRHGKAIKDTPVSITAGALNEQTIVMNTAMVKLTASETEGGPELGSGLFWWVHKKGDDGGKGAEVDRAGTAKPLFVLPAGDYVVAVRKDGVVFDAPLTLAPGEEKAHKVNLSAASSQ